MKVENADIETHWELLQLLVKTPEKKVYGAFKAAMVRMANMVDEMGKKVYFHWQLDEWSKFEASNLSSLWQFTKKGLDRDLKKPSSFVPLDSLKRDSRVASNGMDHVDVSSESDDDGVPSCPFTPEPKNEILTSAPKFSISIPTTLSQAFMHFITVSWFFWNPWTSAFKSNTCLRISTLSKTSDVCSSISSCCENFCILSRFRFLRSSLTFILRFAARKFKVLPFNLFSPRDATRQRCICCSHRPNLWSCSLSRLEIFWQTWSSQNFLEPLA